MLRNRIITAIILAPLAVLAVFYLPLTWFGLLFWLVASLALYEWAGLLHVKTPWGKLFYLFFFAVTAFCAYQVPEWYDEILIIGCLVWVVAAAGVLLFPRFEQVYPRPFVLAPLGLIIATVAWLAIMLVRQQPDGEIWVVWMFLVVWGADVGAYFTGKQFGRTPLAASVSPKKTWEGVAGGLLLPGVVCGGAVFLWQENGLQWVVITVALIVISVFGDLFESVLKRTTGVKDSGTLLPGHGGMLDRIDSLLAVLPFMAAIHVLS